ncbi:MAG: hypothetical protein ACYDCQ_18995 [Dehalococcoidia bacterium]
MRLRSRLLAVASLAAAVAMTGGLALVQSGVHAQTGTTTPASNVGGPQNVPYARFFGSVTLNGSAAPAGATVVGSVGGVVCGTGTSDGSQYKVDLQAIVGCTTPGASVSFTVNGNPAVSSPAAVLPQIQGTAVLANLTATTATPSPTPSPSPTATPPPPPPPPPPPVITASPTKTPTPAPTAVVPVRPPSTGLGGTQQQKPTGPVAQKAAAPVAQKAGAAAAAPAARPALPNTGTGGLTGDSAGSAPLPLLLLAAALGLTLAGARALVSRRP